MAYIQIQDVRLGMNRKRKSRVASEIGSAWTIKNGHLTRGGDIERRKKFVKQTGSFPSSTAGLYTIGTTLHTVGYDATQAGNVPAGVSHVLTQHPTPATAITAIKDADAFDGDLYSIVEYTDGNIYHFYNTTRVTDWDTIATTIGDNDAIASALADAINKSATVNATSSGAIVTVTAIATNTAFTITGSTVNNGSNSDETLTIVQTVAPSVGVAQVSTATIGGTFEAADQFTVIIDLTEEYVVTGRSSGTGISVLTFKQKLYSTASSNLYFCALNAPSQWISGIDYGFINMASQRGGEEDLVTAEEYQGLMAIFSANNIRIWSISESSAANVVIQTIQNTGTEAPNSVLAYGNNDVFYYHYSGIRSLKARDSSNAAYVSDVGTAIDTHVREYSQTLTNEQKTKAVSAIEPVDGRFWMAIGHRVYVLSYFPSAKISAWSYYELDFQITHFAKVKDKIYARGIDDNGDEHLYLYGGSTSEVYPDADEDVIEIELPFFSAKDPSSFKTLNGFDITAINDWRVDLLPDPSDETVIKTQGVTRGVTYNNPQFSLLGVTSLFAVNLTCSAAGSATFSALAMHYSEKVNKS